MALPKLFPNVTIETVETADSMHADTVVRAIVAGLDPVAIDKRAVAKGRAVLGRFLDRGERAARSEAKAAGLNPDAAALRFYLGV